MLFEFSSDALAQYPMLSVNRGFLSVPNYSSEEREGENGDDDFISFPLFFYNHSDRPVMMPSGFMIGTVIDEAETPSGVEALVNSLQRDVDAAQRSSNDATDDGGPDAEELPLDDIVPHDLPDREVPDDEVFRQVVNGYDYLDGSEKERLLATLLKHKRAFALNPKSPDGAYDARHQIHELEGSRPVTSHPHRLSPEKRAASSVFTKELLEAKIIKRSSSPYASPIVLAKKKDGTWRFCVDYRKLNRQTIPDKFPLPRVDDILDSLGGNLFFSSMDLASGFHQIPIDPAHTHKSAFITHEGLFEFIRMPFGLTNAPATFQRTMNMVLAGLNWVECLCYVDDVLVYSKTAREHLETLDRIFTRLEEAGLSLKLSKCSFMAPEVEYLGHIVDRHGTRPNNKNTDAIRKFPVPNDVLAIQRFNGLCNYYSRFIPNFAVLREPLVNLTRKGVVWEWTEEHQNAFDTLVKHLTETPLLAHPDFEKPFEVTTDACNYGLGAVLTQINEDGSRQPIQYISKTLSRAERKWATRELEALAVVWACEVFRPYIGGKEFTVRTDHQSLKWLMDAQTPGRIARWAIRLQEFLPGMKLEYLKGEDNPVADALSRAPLPDVAAVKLASATALLRVRSHLYHRLQHVLAVTRSSMTFANKNSLVPHVEALLLHVSALSGPSSSSLGGRKADEPAGTKTETETETETGNATGNFARSLSLTLTQMRDALEADPKWSQLLAFLEGKENTLTPNTRVQMVYRAEFFEVGVNGLLYLKGFHRRNRFDPRVPSLRMVVPDRLRRRIVSEFHDSLTGVHLGTSRVIPEVSRRFYFPNLDRFIRDHVRTCRDCQFARARRDLRAGLMVPKNNVNTLGYVGLDLQGPYPSSNGFTWILTMKDSLSHMVVLVPLKDGNTHGSVIAEKLFYKWVGYYGLPLLLTTDRGPQMMGEILHRFCELLGIDKTATSTYHAQTNTEPERQHGFHTPLLKALCHEHPKDWSRRLPYLQFACISTVVDGAGMAPLEIHTGVAPLLPTDLYALSELQLAWTAKQDQAQHGPGFDHALKIKEARDLMIKVNTERRNRDKARRDQGQHDVSYRVGDHVLSYRPAKVEGSRKLALDMRGPFVVVKEVTSVTYILLHEDSGVQWTAHVSNMHPYHQRQPDSPEDWSAVDAELPKPLRPPPPPPTPVSEEEKAPDDNNDLPESVRHLSAEDLVYLEITNRSNKTLFIAESTPHGLGVFLRVATPKDRVLGEYLGELIDETVFRRRYKNAPPIYALRVKGRHVIDASNSGNFAKYINCAGPNQKPNVRFYEDRGRVFIWTLRHIEAGEQLLANYGDGYRFRDGREDILVLHREVLPLLNDYAEEVKNTLSKVEEKEGPPDERDHLLYDDSASDAELSPSNLLNLNPGEFLLVQADDDESFIDVARVISVSELGERVLLHIWSPKANGVYFPHFQDPKDKKSVLLSLQQAKKQPRLVPFTFDAYPGEIRSTVFQLKQGRVPADLATTKGLRVSH